MKKILIGIDGSRPSMDALNYLLKMSKELNIGLTAIRVINEPRMSEWIGVKKVMLKQAEEEAKVLLNEVVSIARNSGVEIETVIKKGDPSEEITKYARADNDVVLVGIGHIGRGMTARRVLGSVAYLLVNEVSRAMPCPVMVISSGECKYFKGGGILVASDGSIPSLHALRYSIDLAKRVDAKVIAISVKSISRFSHWISAHKKLEEEMTEEAKRNIEKVKEIGVEKGVDIEGIVRTGEPPDEIVKLAKERNTALIAIGASGKHLTARRLLGSVTEGVLNQLGKNIICPVVVVPGVDEVIHERLGI